MKSEIDTSFQTLQRDIFASGIAAEIGMNAFGVWLAIKAHADYNNGECWPGVRKLSNLTGLSTSTISASIKRLVDVHLLRILEEGGGRRSARYIARERLTIRLGKRVLCTVVLDYVPSRLRLKLDEIDSALRSSGDTYPAFADCEILPGDGFVWDANSRTLKASIPHDEIPDPTTDDEASYLQQSFQQRLLGLQHEKSPRSAVENTGKKNRSVSPGER